ncbi:hypothetical protein AXW78_09080 [Bacillus thuringiensis]|uniref:Uncharacterized protein n=1 Tax=Bacillus thuringiensis TaxID=1428 RepID=A0A9W3YFX5_BACTU|nr:hypothetical protein AXW78_09080 [Bacillus thuringiensis]ASZ66368.1 hypothetical protein CJ306_14000 [Bacillus cereus]AYF80090.1 hypothetical protein D7J84_02250 [Bacillus thuringiensis]PNK23165.1 hypothetical protein CBR55_32840 [Bacillus thuringiensis]
MSFNKNAIWYLNCICRKEQLIKVLLWRLNINAFSLTIIIFILSNGEKLGQKLHFKQQSS